jgi:hypothetical protein
MIETIREVAPEERPDHQKVFEALALAGPAVFLERLIPPDVVDTQYSRFSETNSRNFLLLRILIEVQKAGMAMGRVRQAATEAERQKPSDRNDNVDRLCIESMIDEISLWQRKLSESLVLLINFASTNDHASYYHFLLIHERQRQFSQRKEQQEFFSFPNEVTNRQLARVEQQIEAVENANPVLKSAWYVRHNKGKPELTSFNHQLKAALLNAEPMEKKALGYTYAKGFGESSGNIHFSPVRPDHPKPSQRFGAGLAFCGFLTASILRRAHALTGLAPEKINARCLSSWQEQRGTPLTCERAKIGDFVFVDGPTIGVVEEIEVGPFDYERYRVKYVIDPPDPDIDSEWFTAFDVFLFSSKSDLVATLRNMLSRHQADGSLSLDLQLSDAEIDEALSQAMAEMWRRGLRGYVKKATTP